MDRAARIAGRVGPGWLTRRPSLDLPKVQGEARPLPGISDVGVRDCHFTGVVRFSGQGRLHTERLDNAAGILRRDVGDELAAAV